MSHQTSQSADKQLNNLMEFRQAAYKGLGRAKDALFELADAVQLTQSLPSIAHLSLCPLFRRKWPSVYEALQDGTPDRDALLQLYSSHVHDSTYPTLATPRVLLAGDNTAWPRPLARTLSERTYLHQPATLPGLGGRPITVGHSYSTVAWVPEEEGSWALPLLHERITSGESVLDKAADQLSRARKCLPGEVQLISMYDSQYGCAPFVEATSSIECDKVLRLRPNLRLFEPPPPYKGRGPHPKHGPPFKLNDPDTWSNTDELLWVDDPVQGWVLVQVWHSLHFRASPRQPMTLIRVSRPGARGTRRDPKAQWLAWVGYGGKKPPPVEEWWRVYGRRFALDHWYRFAKQRLHWTTPHLATPRQCEVWSDLMPLVMWELWLCRGVVADRPLPWHNPQRANKLTPGRVAEGMAAVIARIGTPACVPKPRGYSPGWPTGQPRKPRARQPVLKKAKNRLSNAQNTP
ncbi:MAG TPA: NF041680 family putative transposase [Chloroflexia bacterium]|nr:NF041680 family putative transposase [Chloroflexia bacterium]